MIQVIVFIASCLFIINKGLLLHPEWIVKEEIKWSFGMIAAIMFIIYFFAIGSPILATLEIGLTILSLYRTIVGLKRNLFVEKVLGIFTGLVILVLFIEKYNGYIETLQLAGSICMIIGTFYLIRDEYKKGFTIYAFGHIFLSIFGYGKGELIFWLLQYTQALICFTVFLNKKEKLIYKVS